jgi:hypothetical protein
MILDRFNGGRSVKQKGPRDRLYYSTHKKP